MSTSSGQTSADPSPETLEGQLNSPQRNRFAGALVSFIGWIAAILMVGLVVVMWLGFIPIPQLFVAPATPAPTPVPSPTVETRAEAVPASLPPFELLPVAPAVFRIPDPETIIPPRPRVTVIKYEVVQNDSVFGIAEAFKISPETVLWANFATLKDSPHSLDVGMELNIPPVNGVYYEWQEGDTLESVADRFEAEVDDILTFSGNKLDLAEPSIEPGKMIMIPDGRREFQQWIVPTIARANAGVTSAALGAGACSGSYDGAIGSGYFVWPTGNHYLSGNDYWSGHLAIDLAAGLGDGVYAADAGVVVFSGWANGGYGNTIVIDHGNGYQTLYAHLSNPAAGCGRSVSAGVYIGAAGSTGNSTGPHLHFEVRLNGGFVNPWYVLPNP